MIMRQVAKCESRSGVTGDERYFLTLSCGHNATAPKRNRNARFDKRVPSRKRCIECEQEEASKEAKEF